MALPLLFHNQGKGRPIGGGGVTPAPTPPFSPGDLAGLILWLDGSDIDYLYQDSGKTTPVTSDGDVVGAWADKSGNGNDVTQGTTANKPLYKASIINSLGVVRFDGANDELTKTVALTPNDCTIFVVWQNTDDEDIGGIIESKDVGTPSNKRISVYGDTRTATKRHSIYAPDASNNFIDLASKNSEDTTYISCVAVDEAVRMDGWINGASLTGVTNATNHDALDTVNVGTSLSLFFKGDVAEILVYNSLLSAANRNNAGDYLAERWGGTWIS